MARKKREAFQLPKGKSELALGEVPEFMKGHISEGLENIGADEIVWMAPGEDGELEVRLPKDGYEQYSPFDLILLGIIRAHPREGQRKRPDANEHERLGRARAALFGSPELDRGRPRTDDEILLKVARGVLEAIVAGNGDEVELASLMREAATPYYKAEELARNGDSESRIIRRLITHFERDRDELLTRMTLRADWRRARNLKTIGEILDRLESLGVEVSRESVPQMNVKGEVSAKLRPRS
jgi:hypothetical protein